MVQRLLMMILIAATGLAGGCQINPATGQTNLNFISQGQEIQLGEEGAPNFLASYGGLIPDPQVCAYVENLGQRLATQSERKDLPWHYYAVNSPVVNAFALPGGKIFITRGLMEKLGSEAELAGVLGHETGHVTAQHVSQQMTQQMGINAGLAIIGVAAEHYNKDYLRVLGDVGSVGGSLYMLHFSRSDENEADELGVRYMTRLGYAPLGQVRVMEVLQKLGGSSGSLEMLSTHPYPETRIARLQQLIPQQYPDYQNTAKYKWNTEEYKATVLNRLAKLPPAPPPPPQQQ